MGDINFSCPKCEGDLVVDERGAGLQVQCKLCGAQIRVPEQIVSGANLLPKTEKKLKRSILHCETAINDAGLRKTEPPLVKLSCPHCSQHIEVPEELLGQNIDCPTCKRRIQISNSQQKVAQSPERPPSTADSMARTTTSNASPLPAPIVVAEGGQQTRATGLGLYMPSGRVPRLAVVLVVAIGLPVAILVGFLEGFLCEVNPLIYLNILAPVGAGIAVGATCALGAYLGKMRNPGVLMLIASLCVLVADGLSFVAADSVNHSYEGFWTAIARRVSEGHEISHLAFSQHEQSSGGHFLWIPIKGFFMLPVLAFELVLFFVGTAKGVSYMTTRVFCENCSRWARVTREGWSNLNPAKVQNFLQSKLFPRHLNDLADPIFTHRMKFRLQRCSKCRSQAYLSLIEEIPGNDSKKKTQKVLVENALINDDFAVSIEQAKTKSYKKEYW